MYKIILMKRDDENKKKGAIWVQIPIAEVMPHTKLDVFVNDDKSLLMSTFYFHTKNTSD